MESFDYKKELGEFYNPRKNRPAIVDVPPSPHIVIDDTGDPNTSERFQAAVTALFSVSYYLKFSVKKAGVLDYKVMPLSGYWTLVDPSIPDPENRDNWTCTIGIQQPEIIEERAFTDARHAVQGKKRLPIIDELRLESIADGLCAQILHVGPFSEEPRSFAVLNSFIEDEGYRIAAPGHREIYLSDFNRTAPEKLRTILRKKIALGD